uniref:Large ribosomal subunit protein eL34 n=1 Tax=Megaselia scalaris TaxID=36166 RepID=T1H0T5_MEGSC
ACHTIPTPTGGAFSVLQVNNRPVPKWSQCKEKLKGIRSTRPCERSRICKRQKTVARSYGDSTHPCSEHLLSECSCQYCYPLTPYRLRYLSGHMVGIFTDLSKRALLPIFEILEMLQNLATIVHVTSPFTSVLILSVSFFI